MENKTTIILLVVTITALAAWATITGITSNEGRGSYAYHSIRGREVMLYGKGLYKDMSAEVAPQGIAQDYVTLLIGIPMLLISLRQALKGRIKGSYLLAGTLGYFLVTYLFYTVMGMYNQLFLVYVGLMGASFYGFLLTLLPFRTKDLAAHFKKTTPLKATGGFLIFISVTIALLWLSIVTPPLFDGTIIPIQAEHYTTLVVQGLDLGILLPGAFICGVLWMKRHPVGYLMTPIYYVFLSILISALTAKVIAMALLGYNVIPAIFIIPAINLLTILSTITIYKNLAASHPGNNILDAGKITMEGQE